MDLKTHPLHERGILVSNDYRKNERELVWILQEMAKQDLFRQFGYSGATHYVVQEWKLSETSAGLLVGVAYLGIKAPEVSRAVQSGELTLSKARRIAAPINKGQDAKKWIEVAISIPQKELEREVVRENPELAIQEKIIPVFGERSELHCGISAKLEEKIKRGRELASRSMRKIASIEETLEWAFDLALKHMDPVQKAERAAARTERKKQTAKAEPVCLSKLKVASKLKHQVNLRDRGECQERVNGRKCLSRQFTDVHHVVDRRFGGKDTLENLITLCKFHHQRRHGFESRYYRAPKVSEAFHYSLLGGPPKPVPRMRGEVVDVI